MKEKELSSIIDKVIEEAGKIAFESAQANVQEALSAAREEGRVSVMNHISETVAHQEFPFSYIHSKVAYSESCELGVEV